MNRIPLRSKLRLALACTAVAIGAAVAALGSQWATAAEPTGQPTLEELLKPPALAGATLSRTGKYFAATTSHKGRMNLVVIDMKTRKGDLLTSFEDFDVLGVRWIGDDRLLFTLGQQNSPTGPGQFLGGGLFMVSRDGRESRRLAPTVQESRRNNQVHRSLDFFRLIPGSDEEIMAVGNMTDALSRDLYRLNIRTGKYSLLTQGRPASQTHSWILDSKQVPRVVSAGVKDTLTEVVYYRAGENEPWTEIARYDVDKGPTFVPLAFESDDKTLQIAANPGRDTMAVYRYDPAAKKLGELIASNPKYDMGANALGQGVSGAIVRQRDNKILGYGVDGAKPEAVWLDEEYAKNQAALDNTLKNRVNVFSRAPDGKGLVVRSYSDQSPVRWYLFDDEKVGSPGTELEFAL